MRGIQLIDYIKPRQAYSQRQALLLLRHLFSQNQRYFRLRHRMDLRHIYRPLILHVPLIICPYVICPDLFLESSHLSPTVPTLEVTPADDLLSAWADTKKQELIITIKNIRKTRIKIS